MDKKLRETTYLCVKIMNSKRQMYCKGETWSPGTNFVTWCLTSLIDLLSLYVLFSQYRSGDNTLENCFFQISSCSRAYVCWHKNTKCQVPLGPLFGKQTMKPYKLKRSIPPNPVQQENPGGGGYSTNVYSRTLHPEVQPLTLYIPFFTKKVPLPVRPVERHETFPGKCKFTLCRKYRVRLLFLDFKSSILHKT